MEKANDEPTKTTRMRIRNGNINQGILATAFDDHEVYDRLSDDR